MTPKPAASQHELRAKLLGVERNGTEYLVRLKDVRRMLTPVGMEQDSMAPAFVIGVLPEHGRLPVVDLAERLGAPAPAVEQGLVIVAMLEDVEVGFLINRSTGITHCLETDLQGEGWMAGMHSHPEGIKGVLQHDGDCTELLSMTELFSLGERTAILSFGRAEHAAFTLAGAGKRKQQEEADKARRRNPLLNLEGSYVIVRAGEQLFGLHTKEIVEILPASGLRRIPLADESVAGILLLRDQTFTVADLRLRLGLPGKPCLDHAVILLVRDGASTTGVRVDAVVGRRFVSVSELRPCDPMKLDIHWEFVKASARMEVGTSFLLDVQRVLSDTRPPLLCCPKPAETAM